ncbi:MAG: hypothetical protein MJZ41_16215, partial [Bacteroidaceae bacterium]|nr:hypothetical protein [Bacteroidaceae bacterium]
DNEFLGSEEAQHTINGDKAILFDSGTKAQTRAEGSAAAGLLNNNFVVMGIKGDGSTKTKVFDHYNVNYIEDSANKTETNVAGWEYVGQTKHTLSSASAQNIKYWDYSAKQYDFVGFSYGKSDYAKAVLTAINYANLGKAVDETSNANAVYTVTGTADELAKTYVADLVTVYNRNNVSEFGKTVTLKFRSLGAKVRVALYETVPGYSVKNVKFYSEAWDGTKTTTECDTKATLFAASAVFPSTTSKGTMSVYYPTVGWDNKANTDYNQAQVKFTAGTKTGEALGTTKDFGALTNLVAAEGTEATGNIYLGRTSNTATYAGAASNNYYQTVLPLGTKDNLQIRIEYDLVSTDGSGEIIHVRDASAVVPAAYADWKPNYAYTYIFKISDATNGWTGVDGSGNVVQGLTPITFDAVVVDTEDGIQETITTVSTPSITTYQEGKAVTAGSEYQAGDIYVTAVDGTTPTGSNITLYQVTQAVAGAPITEATCALAYDKGKTDPSSDLYDKTNIYLTQLYGGTTVSSVPTSDGSAIAVPAFKFTATSGLTYVVRYNGGTGKVAYKVIRVQ